MSRSHVEQFKQVIVVNESLKLPRGKLAAQVAYASVASLLVADRNHIHAWLDEGMPEVVVTGTNEAIVVSCYEIARASKIATQLIRDAGRTVIAAGTITRVGIGQAPQDEIDMITAELKLLK